MVNPELEVMAKIRKVAAIGEALTVPGNSSWCCGFDFLDGELQTVWLRPMVDWHIQSLRKKEKILLRNSLSKHVKEKGNGLLGKERRRDEEKND